MLCPARPSLRPTSASGSATRDAGRQRAVFGHLADFYGAFVDAHHRIAESLFVALSRKSSFRSSTRLAYGSTKSYYRIQVIQGSGDIVVVQRGSIEIVEEGFHLPAALRSEGSAGADETQIGSIERVMIDKRSGKVSYAVLSFGGFLGIGDDHYPLPWESLKYDTNLGGYRTGITESQLHGAPKYSGGNDWNWEDQARTRGVNDYYGVIPT
jgi:hypothetical protein